MMCPVKSRNGNNLRVKKQSRRGETLLVRFCCDPQRKVAREMTFEINLVVCCVVAVLTGSSQTREGPWNEVSQQTRNPAGRDETSAQATIIARTEGTVHSGTATNALAKAHLLTTSSAVATPQHMNVPAVMTAPPGAPSPSAAADDSLSSTPTAQRTTPPQHLSTEGGAPLTRDPLATFSSQPAHTVQDTSSTAHASTSQPQSESLNTVTAAQPTTTGYPLTSATGWGPAGPTHQEVPSELNVGDEDLKGPRYHSSSPLDPLLAGLLSVFIVTTAIVFVILLLKFRQRTNHPEFHRLQDLPMDDLMEDTPLSRYSY